MKRGLPKLLEELAEVMDGPQGAYKLSEEFGGLDLYVPGKPRKGQLIAEACGMDVARALASIRGNERVTVPLTTTDCLKRNRILKSQGSPAQIARATGCTVRYVKLVRAQAKTRAPLPLFSGLDKAG